MPGCLPIGCHLKGFILAPYRQAYVKNRGKVSTSPRPI
jgi:hypothetical protein